MVLRQNFRPDGHIGEAAGHSLHHGIHAGGVIQLFKHFIDVRAGIIAVFILYVNVQIDIIVVLDTGNVSGKVIVLIVVNQFLFEQGKVVLLFARVGEGVHQIVHHGAGIHLSFLVFDAGLILHAHDGRDHCGQIG